jgi:hypothetical protein
MDALAWGDLMALRDMSAFDSWLDACDKLEEKADKEEIEYLKATLASTKAADEKEIELLRALLASTRADLKTVNDRLVRMGQFLQETDAFYAFLEWENCTLEEGK